MKIINTNRFYRRIDCPGNSLNQGPVLGYLKPKRKVKVKESACLIKHCISFLISFLVF